MGKALLGAGSSELLTAFPSPPPCECLRGCHSAQKSLSPNLLPPYPLSRAASADRLHQCPCQTIHMDSFLSYTLAPTEAPLALSLKSCSKKSASLSCPDSRPHHLSPGLGHKLREGRAPGFPLRSCRKERGGPIPGTELLPALQLARSAGKPLGGLLFLQKS